MLHTRRHILSSRAHSDKIPTATPMFQGTNFLVVVLPVSWDVDVCLKSKMAAKLPEVRITIQVLQIHMSPENNTGVYDYVRNIWMSNSHGRRYLVSKIQDGNQLTGSTDISETTAYTINIPTNRKRRPKPEILISLKLWKVQLKFQRQIWDIGGK